MLCLKCGADNNEDDIFCTNCGAVLIGVSLDDPETEEAAPQAPAQQKADEQPKLVQEPAQQNAFEQPVPSREPAQQNAPEQPDLPQEPAHYAPRSAAQPRQRRRRRRNPQGIEWIPIGGAVLALLFLFLPWFSVFEGLQKWSLMSIFFDMLGEIGSLGFLNFVCLALYLVLIVSPVMIGYFAWRRDNNYMGLSLLAVGCAVLAAIFTSIGFGKDIGFGVSAGFFLYMLAIAAVIAGGVMLSIQRQKNPRRPRTK